MKQFKTMVSAMAFLAILAIMAIPARANTTNDQIVGSTAISAGLGTPVILVGTCDFTATTAAAGDVYKVIYIPAYSTVLEVYAEVTTTNETAMTYGVGDGTATNTWLAATQNGGAKTKAISATGRTAYTAANYISVVPNAVAATGKIKVKALVVPF